MRLVLWRKEFLELRRSSSWVLMFGRRKTGKSFLARLVVPWSLYATVTRDLHVVLEARGDVARIRSPDTAIPLLVNKLRDEEVVVLDEFQRLPERYWTLLASAHPNGRLVLAGSSLGVVDRVFNRRSPLLGLLLPVRIDPISLEDVIVSLANRTGPSSAVLWAVLLREPWLAPFADLGKHPLEYLEDNIVFLSYTIRGLVGEVFLEEERELTRLYESILRLLGGGVWSSRDLTNILFSRGLIQSPSPGIVTGILDRMMRMGLVVKTRLWRSRGGRLYYRHLSPLLSIVYGAMERLALDEVPVLPKRMMRGTLEILLTREVSFSLGEMLTQHHNGVQAYTVLEKGGGDIDVVVLDKRGRSPIIAYEIKLGTCSPRDRRKLEERSRKVGVKKARLLCLGGGGDLDANDVIEIAKDLVRERVRGLGS